MSAEFTYRDSRPEDAPRVGRFIEPFVARKQLLPRNEEDLLRLTRHGFLAELQGEIVGCAAVEVYSSKLAEVQCLAVHDEHHGKGIGKQLVQMCIERARRERVLELMVISSSDEFLRSCGFDYSLPSQRRALFIHTRDDE